MADEEGWQAHDPRVVTLDREVGWVVTACVSGGWALAILLIWALFDAGTVAMLILAATWPAVTALSIWLGYSWPAIDYRHARYRLLTERIELEHGVWWRHSTFVPRSRVQHIAVTRGPFERRHGLATLTIYTAGTIHSAVPLRGLADEVAVALRAELLPRPAETDGV